MSEREIGKQALTDAIAARLRAQPSPPSEELHEAIAAFDKLVTTTTHLECSSCRLGTGRKFICDLHGAEYDAALVDVAWRMLREPAQSRSRNEAPTGSPPGEGLATISAGHAANHPLIRRILLDAWHDLRWYRANHQGEHPGHAWKTVDAIEAAIRAGDEFLHER